MTKGEFTDALMMRSDDIKSKAAAGRIIDDFLSVLEDEMAAGNSVQFVGFGTFHVSKREERMGVNPQTGEKIKIAAKAVPHFKPGRPLKERVAASK